MLRTTLTFALLLSIATPALAQETSAEAETEEPPTPENMIVADLSLGVISLGYERVLDPRVAIQLAVGVYGPWYVTEGMLGFGGEARVFLFMEAHAPFGFYLSPGVRGAWVQADEGARTGGAFSVRLSFGYSIDISPIVIRLGGGAQYHLVELDEPDTEPTSSFAGIFGVVDIYVGWAF